MSQVTGIHHITVCASGAQEDIDFLTQVAGQRLIKQTILFDGRYAHYHLYNRIPIARPDRYTRRSPISASQAAPARARFPRPPTTFRKAPPKSGPDHLVRTR